MTKEHLIAFGLAAIAAIALTPALSHAACTVDGTTATCKGSLIGVDSMNYAADSGVDTLIVEDIDDSYDINADAIMSVVSQGDDGSDTGDAGDDGDDVQITYDTGDYGFKGTDSTTAIEVSSQGGDGVEGEDKDNATTAGSGGAGGAGGDATLSMTSGWYEQDTADTGFSVVSQGGTGGQGGEGKVKTTSDDEDALGGAGGDGGAAGTVTATLSDLSDDGVTLSGVGIGIEVVSTGGTGGEGGEAHCENGTGPTDCIAKAGEGGDGGAAGTASLDVTDATLSIDDISSTGIVVSSIGGDGGKGGETKLKGTDESWADNDGSNGRGGKGGDGGAASLTLDGATVTVTDSSGDADYAIAVTSAGGAGGTGGKVEAQSECKGNDTCYPGFGDGGAGGDAAEASMSLTDSDVTALVSKDGAVAVWIGSVGGEGGDIGSANHTNSEYWVESDSDRFDTAADGGAGGAGGTASVEMDSDSTLTVTIDGASPLAGALTMISLGGAGGDGGNDKLYGYDSVGGAGGAGGDVTATFGGLVTATTSGDYTYGLLFQSIGGGGGTAYLSDGAGGAGGAIDVTLSDVSIMTSGESAHGIVAETYGGGGGDSSSGGDGGDGGTVVLGVTGGTVGVSGDDAYGISAISSGGAAGSGSGGEGGDVTVTAGADITASGTNGIGIYGESTGTTTAGDIKVTIDSGGTVTASGDSAVAIKFVNGGSNTLTNNGTITTSDLSSSSILALTTSDAVLAVTNNGIFGGSVELEEGYGSTFTNASGGTLNLGASFDLGSDGKLTNEGTVSPGGSGSIQTSTITGVFEQTSDGNYLVDIDSSNSDLTDLLLFETDGAVMDGTVSVNVITAPSTSDETIIAFAQSGSLTNSGLTVSDTASVDYGLNLSSADSVYLSWTVDMASPELLGSANSNQSEVARHLQQAMKRGDQLGRELSSLLNIVHVENYLAALDTFIPQIASDTQLSTLLSSQHFSDALLSCSVRDGVYRFVDQNQCAWLQLGGSRTERSSSVMNRRFDQDTFRTAAGGQFRIAESWHLGAAFGVEAQNLNVDTIATSDGEVYHGGVVVKHTLGNTMFSGSLAGGYGDFDITRYLFSGDVAMGTQTMWLVSGQISASHAFVRGHWYLKPRVDLGFDHLVTNGFSESGAGGADLNVNGNTQTYYNVQPAIELGGEIGMPNDMLLRPKLVLGLTQFLGDAAPKTTSSFVDTPSAAALTTTSEFDKTYFDLSAGLELLASDRLSLSATGFGQFSKNITSYGGSAKFAVRF